MFDQKDPWDNGQDKSATSSIIQQILSAIQIILIYISQFCSMFDDFDIISIPEVTMTRLHQYKSTFLAFRSALIVVLNTPDTPLKGRGL